MPFSTSMYARRPSLEITRENSGVKRGNYKTKVAVIHLDASGWWADFDDRLVPKGGRRQGGWPLANQHTSGILVRQLLLQYHMVKTQGSLELGTVFFVLLSLSTTYIFPSLSKFRECSTSLNVRLSDIQNCENQCIDRSIVLGLCWRYFSAANSLGYGDG